MEEDRKMLRMLEKIRSDLMIEYYAAPDWTNEEVEESDKILIDLWDSLSDLIGEWRTLYSYTIFDGR